MASSSYFAWDLIDRGASPCIRDDVLVLDYQDFATRVEAAAEQLCELGITAGDVVATMLPNRVELLVTLMAAWRLGAIATPVNPSFTAVEAGYQLDDSAARVVVAEVTNPGARDGCVQLDVDTLRREPSPQWRAPSVDLNDADALLIYTSGSTGRPKGVRLDHPNLRYMAGAMAQLMSLTEADHALLILPLFHVNAICVSFLAPMLSGGQLTITGRFSASRFFGDLVTLRPTYFSAVPTIYAMLAAMPTIPDRAFDSLRFAICGAAPISKELLDRVEGLFGIPVVEGYGLTEGTCASACNPVDGLRKLGTVGPAIPGQRIRIVDAEGVDVATGQIGEVLISGPNVMRGYLNRPEATAATLADDWLRTGDIGSLDADGYLTIVDRIKDMIIRGGENLYPKEIENALATHPGVLECAVVGAQDELFGEVPVAFVVTYPDSETTAAILDEYLVGMLAKVKRPTVVHLVEQLPRNPVGKIDKPSLRAELVMPQEL